MNEEERKGEVMNRMLVCVCAVVALLPIVQEHALSIPAFGRKYAMSCQTCHAPFPRLKPYGAEFAGNGFAIADKDAPRYFMKTGDEDLSLLRELPLAIRFEGYLTYNLLQSERMDFSAPYLVKLLSGGALAEHFSYYFYFFLGERGDVAGMEDAFLMINDLFGAHLDLYLGQFQVSDPLFKRELRLTFEDYRIYTAKPGLSRADLTYDRGIMLTYGLPTGTDIVLEVLNGTGIGGANSFQIFDEDKYKNLFGRISQEVIPDRVRMGAFGYWGKEELAGEAGTAMFTNAFRMWGPDLTLNLGDVVELNAQYARRIDDKPELLRGRTETKGIVGELILTPEKDQSPWYAVALYNKVDSDMEELAYESMTGSLGWLLRRNIRLVGEYTHRLDKKFGQAAVGIVAAF